MLGMGRRRQHNKHLPQYVTLECGTYYFRGPDRKRLRLGRSFAEAMRAYADLYKDVPLTRMGSVLDKYLQTVTPDKAAITQKYEQRYIATIRGVFGSSSLGSIAPLDVYKFRDTLAAKSGAVQANLHLSCLKHVLSKAAEWGAADSNAARDVRKLPIAVRDRYVTQDEYDAVRALASPLLRVAMDLALLTGMRRGDLLALTRSQLKDDGIHVRTSKTGKRLIIEWSDELREVVALAKKIKPQVRQSVLATRQGKPYSADGFSSIWHRLMRKAVDKGAIAEPFHFHDLRAMSATQSADVLEASQRLGHANIDLTRRVYMRKPTKVKPLR